MAIDIGHRLAEARHLKKLTQEDLSELTGVSISGISRIETGKNSVTLDTLLKFCDVLGVGPDFLLYDYLPPSDKTEDPDIQHVISLLKTMNKADVQFILAVITLYISRNHD